MISEVKGQPKVFSLGGREQAHSDRATRHFEMCGDILFPRWNDSYMGIVFLSLFASHTYITDIDLKV